MAEGRNRVLMSLEDADRALLTPHMEPVRLQFRQKLQSKNRRIDYLLFLETGVVSYVAGGASAALQAEVGMVGSEGVTGVSSLLGAEHSSWDAFVQVEGAALRIAQQDLQRAVSQSDALRARLLRYAHTFHMQCGATALANAHGTIEARLARWLLMVHDRHGEDTIPLTHEFVAVMLGVRRPGVTIAFHQLEARGLVRGARGSVKILDRNGLRDHAGGLYGAPEAEYERLFPKT